MHIHLSYFDLFLIAAAAGGYYWWRMSKRKNSSDTAYTYGKTDDGYYVKQTGESPWTPNHRTLNPVIRENENPWSTTRNVQPAPAPTQTPSQPHYSSTPTYAAPQPTTVVHEHYHGGGSGSDMLTGVLVGEMIAGGGRGGSTTVVNNNTVVEGVDHNNHDQSNYVDNGSWDSTPSTPSNDNSSSGWDFSIGGSDSSSDSSSGFDISIGSDC